MYKYDIHVHTMETSRCGYIKAPETAETYKRLGYDGICVTDHLHGEFISLMHCRDDWQACMDQYMFGYHEAKKKGDAIGLNVCFGIELRFPETESDYLIYGVDEAWLRANPYICDMDHETFFKKYGDEVLIIHAHPYRKYDEVFYDCVHGLEIANCNPRHKSRNELALELARANPHLLRTCGSDMHRPGDEGRAAMLFETPINDSYDIKAAIESGKFRMWCPGFGDIIAQSEADLFSSTHNNKP